jgi:hypothetical protein
MFDRTAGKDLYDSLASDLELLTILSNVKKNIQKWNLKLPKLKVYCK